MVGRMSWSDDDILQAMELAANGMTRAQIGERFGVSKNTIVGVLGRVERDLEASERAPFPPGTGPAVKPENRDGGMPRHWWKRSSQRRGRKAA